MNKGSVFIIAGPSGTGKDTLLKKLFEKHPELEFSISSVTRRMREGEKEGEKYNFISREKFERMIADDQLLEYNVYVGNYYGTPKAPIINATENGKDIIIECDVNGAENIRKKLPDAVSIFIMPPSFEELERRLRGRGTESEQVIRERLNTAIDEIKRAGEFDYIVVNDNVDLAIEHTNAVIQNYRLRYENQKELIDEVLSNAKS